MFEFQSLGWQRANLIVVNMIICPNHVYTVITTKVCSADSQVIHLDVQYKVENNVKLWAVDQDQVMNRGVSWRNQSNKARALGTKF